MTGVALFDEADSVVSWAEDDEVKLEIFDEAELEINEESRLEVEEWAVVEVVEEAKVDVNMEVDGSVLNVSALEELDTATFTIGTISGLEVGMIGVRVAAPGEPCFGV